jgi:hypothetical protein
VCMECFLERRPELSWPPTSSVRLCRRDIKDINGLTVIA